MDYYYDVGNFCECIKLLGEGGGGFEGDCVLKCIFL